MLLNAELDFDRIPKTLELEQWRVENCECHTFSTVVVRTVYMLMCVQPEHICHRHRPTTDRLWINELAILVRLPSTVRLFEQLDSSTLPLYDALAVKFKTQ